MQEKVSETEINKAIRLCIDSGKVKFGLKTATKHALIGKGKLIILSSSAPMEKVQDIKRYAKLSNLPVYLSSLNSKELGSLCGKPFLVSAILIESVGNSKILELVKT
ncbi:MAG: 50S ribosomal protein L30e [Candidatus Anstonellaceae archaeon]